MTPEEISLDELRSQVTGLKEKNADLVEQVKHERSMLIVTVRQKESELDLQINNLKQDVRVKD